LILHQKSMIGRKNHNGAHPYTDIVVHGYSVYSETANNLGRGAIFV